MAIKRLGEIYREKVHGPRDRQGNVYYIPKVNGAELTKEDKELLNNKEYMKMKNDCMNSPTNIKRVWFTTSKVVVEYYAGFKSKGVTKELVVTRTLDTDIYKLAEDMIKYRTMNISQRTMSKLERTEVKGRAFNSLTHPWTCNNIEEIYFDWGALISDESEEILRQCGVNMMQVVTKFANKQEQFSYVENNVPLKMFLGLEKNELSKTFKRLKTVAFISKLDDMVGLIHSTANKFDLNNPVRLSASWLDNEIVQSKIRETNSEVWVSKVNNTTNSNVSIDLFTIKNQQYEFDELYLDTKIRAYITKLKDLIREESGSKDREETVVDNDSIEVLLDSILKEHGEVVVKAVLKASLLSITGKEQFEVLESMSEGRKKYYKTLIS